MSDRSELETQLAELAIELGEEVKVSRLSNEKLAERVAELQAQKAEREAAVKAEAGEKAKAEREAAIKAEAHQKSLESRNANANTYRGRGLKFEYQVAPRKQLQCRAGLLKSGAEVKLGDLGGETEADKRARIEERVAAGAILRRAPTEKPSW